VIYFWPLITAILAVIGIFVAPIAAAGGAEGIGRMNAPRPVILAGQIGWWCMCIALWVIICSLSISFWANVNA